MAQTLEALWADCERAFRQRWPSSTQRLVWGDGPRTEPVLMLIGEAPGEQESLQGKPFVGKAGKNLTAFLQAVALPREQLYVSNVVKVRPTRISAAGRTVNRPPSREEIAFFSPWLQREIGLVRPHALVTLGNVALHALMGKELSIGACHGRWLTATVPVPAENTVTLPLFALYHPASVIYNRALETVYQADLQVLRQRLAQSGTDMDS